MSGDDRFAPAVGFVLAGMGVGSGFLRWTGLLAVGPIESLPGVLFGLIALLGFAPRRYGASDRRFSLLAGLGSGGLTAAATVTALHPSAMGPEGVGPGLLLAFVLGVLGIGVAAADYLGQDRRAVLVRAHAASTALFIGFSGLLVGFGVSMIAMAPLPTSDGLLRYGVSAVAFSLGLGIVAAGYVHLTGRDWSFLDLDWPTRRGWLYVVTGTVGMFAILVVSGWITRTLGIPSAEQGMVKAAKDTPIVLLAFVPLSWLVIGPGEELLSRNVIQKHLYDSFSRPAAVIVATAVFTAMHLPAYATGPLPAIFATLLRLFATSLVLGVVYERTETLVVPVLVHGTYNAAQFAVIYLIAVGYLG
ncbi:MAG: lysostaphin resistance A-like protein [Halodesulfurarchaeum sp.]